jgi:hypothetical protein
MVGQTINQYRILKSSERAAWGSSIEPKTFASARNIAQKFLPDEYSEQRKALERFKPGELSAPLVSSRTNSSERLIPDNAVEVYPLGSLGQIVGYS